MRVVRESRRFDSVMVSNGDSLQIRSKFAGERESAVDLRQLGCSTPPERFERFAISTRGANSQKGSDQPRP